MGGFGKWPVEIMFQFVNGDIWDVELEQYH